MPDLVDQVHAEQGDLVSQVHAETQQQPGSDTWDPRTWDLKHNPVTNTLAGIGSGLAGSGVGLYNVARKIPGVDQVLPAPNAAVQATTQPPAGFFGGAGKFLEQAAEFAFPMSKVAKAAEALPLAARLGTEALAASGVAGVQTGGDVPAMLETGATTGALGGLGAAIPAGVKAALTRALSNGVRPLSQGAIDLAEKYGVPLTQGMKSGSRTVQAVEKLAGVTVAPDLYEPLLEKAQRGVNAGAADLSSGFATDKFSAGQNTIKSMLDDAGDHANAGHTEYANLAAVEADPNNIRPAQVGMKPNPSLDPNAPAMIPDMQPLGLPTDMRPVKGALTQTVDALDKAMTPAQRRMDPGLTAMKNILAGPDAIAASTAEINLGYLKSVLRDTNASASSKRLAGIAIDALQPQVDSAVAQGGQGALDSLHNARGEWAAHSSVMDDVQSLTGDRTGQTNQVSAISKLLAPSDASYPLLEKVLNSAPSAGQDIGKAFLTEKVFKSVADGGDVFPKQARNLWNQIGDRTKAALYTPDQIQNINDLLQLVTRVSENPNPSGTGTMNALMKMGVMVMHPVASIPTFVFGRKIAEVLYNPEAVANVRLALDKLGTPAAGRAMNAVRSIANSTETAIAPQQ